MYKYKHLKNIDYIINEQALDNKEIKKIKKLHDAQNFKLILEKINLKITELKEKFQNIEIDDIILNINKRNEYNKDFIEIRYKRHIQSKINSLFYIFEEIEYDEKITSKFFPDGEMNFNIQIDISFDNYNQIDIMESLPFFIKGLGLGKKIIERIINNYNFISLQNNTNPSKEIKMVFLSLSKNKNYYTFVNEYEDILIYNKNVDFNIIRNFLKNSSKYIIDKDFKKDFKKEIKNFNI